MSKDNNEFLNQISQALGVPAPADPADAPRPSVPPRPLDRSRIIVTLTATREVEIEVEEDADVDTHELAIAALTETYGSVLSIPAGQFEVSDTETMDSSVDSEAQEAWDDQYGDTHNWDGSPQAGDDDTGDDEDTF